MHSETIDFENSAPDGTHPDLKRARAILQRRSTRAVKLERRKDALRLYMNALPIELLMEIFESFTKSLYPVSSNALVACSLVCRKWSVLAQKRLFNHVALFSYHQISMLRRTLTSSNELGGWLRRITVILPRRNPGAPAPVARRIAECLERTPNLKHIRLHISDRALLNDAIIERLQLLPQLEIFQINQYSYLNRPAVTSGFDPTLFRFLPSTVKNLRLTEPFPDLLRALPDVLHRVYPPGDALVQPSRGLKHLEFMSNVPRMSQHIDIPALIGRTFIPATLTSLSLRFSPDPLGENEHSLWNNFMAACKGLQEIYLGTTQLNPPLFSKLPVLERLRVLQIGINTSGPHNEWELFGESIIKYVAQTPCLTDFQLKCIFHPWPQRLIDSFINDLIPKFYTGNRCRLRSFSFGHHCHTPLDQIEEVGEEALHESTHFVPPSIHTFQLMCMRATQLEHLEIAVPLDFLPGVTGALQQLKYLQTVDLNNCFFVIDPALPLGKMHRYKNFLFCCKLLRQHLKLREQARAAAQAEEEEPDEQINQEWEAFQAEAAEPEAQVEQEAQAEHEVQ